MSGPNPTQIVFDIGNVLIEWNPRHLYRKLFDDHDKMEWFLANVFTMDMNRECDRGLLFADAVEQVIARYPEWHEEIRAFDHRWAEMVPGAIEGTVELLAEIRRKKNSRSRHHEFFTREIRARPPTVRFSEWFQAHDCIWRGAIAKTRCRNLPFVFRASRSESR